MQINIRGTRFEISDDFPNHFWKDINRGVWEPETFDVIDRFVSKNDVVLDVGCWAGPITLYLAAKGAAVFALDPDPVAFSELESNIKLNPALQKNIQSFNIALTAHNGPVRLFARSAYGESSTSILQRARDQEQGVLAAGMHLSQFMDKTGLSQIDFIKMDIEAGEFSVLHSIDNSLKEIGLPTLFIAFHYQQLNESIYQNKIGRNKLSLLLLKIESTFGIFIFRRRILRHISQALSIATHYPYIYDDGGTAIAPVNRTATYLLKNRLNLVLSTEEW